ncbi:exopolysaccharide biosynthesis protein [Bdellovibrio sp. SKB1291214]|uniref:exopolysaccharide biosynthesis protein n=1 Tax=Bdellovibrio sp. SKB1291214 TaxID=1732569 RepID=UPI0020CF6FA3|nr:exopolysaccharide biosynthesis protein [Bdellovibrio sp. SKB1291214]UYL08271.1 exopolysaccharide biosynthesis protein [Bdellovibrio sp. SKB1291214]
MKSGERKARLKSEFIAAMDLLQEEAGHGDLSLKKVFNLLGEEGHGMILLILCLPYLFPIPVPGLSTISGMLIILVSFFLFLRRPPWLPQRWENVKISANTIIKTSTYAEKVWTYVAKIVRKRMMFFHDMPVFRLLNFLVLAVNAVLLALPLPIPFSNTVPAISIVLCAIGYLEKDGLFTLFSYAWCAVVASFFTSLAIGAKHLF